MLESSPLHATLYPCSCEPVVDSSRWESLLQGARHMDLMQGWAYGESVRDCGGWAPERQLVSVEGTPVAMAQVLVREVPLVGRVARVPHGPLFLEGTGLPLSRVVPSVLQALREHWTRSRGALLHIAPCLRSGEYPREPLSTLGFSESGEPVWSSIRVDLSPPPDTLRMRLQQRWRTSLNKSEASGLQLRVSKDPSDLARFLERFRAFQRTRQFIWPSPRLVQSVWSHAAEQCELLLIQHQGVQVLELLWVRVADTGLLFAMHSLESARSLRAANFAYWQAALRAKAQGLRWLDLGGIDESNLPQLTFFKRGLAPAGEEYRLLGNFEAQPTSAPTALSRLARESAREGLEPGGEEQRAASGQASPLVREQVLGVLQEFLQQSVDWEGPVDDELELITSGLVDSLSLLGLVSNLERQFSLELEEGELVLEHFNTPGQIFNFISSRLP